MTLRSAPWWWDALAQMAQMSQMQQMNHPGWRMAGPSVAPSAQTTSFWKPLVLRIWSEIGGEQGSHAEFRRLFLDQTCATGGILTPQLRCQLNYPDLFSLCHSALSASLLFDLRRRFSFFFSFFF